MAPMMSPGGWPSAAGETSAQTRTSAPKMMPILSFMSEPPDAKYKECLNNGGSPAARAFDQGAVERHQPVPRLYRPEGREAVHSGSFNAHRARPMAGDSRWGGAPAPVVFPA